MILARGLVVLALAASCEASSPSLRTAITSRLSGSDDEFRYISYGDSTTSGEGIGFEMIYARLSDVMHQQGPKKADPLATETAVHAFMQQNQVSPEELQPPAVTNGMLDDFMRWFNPCGFDPNNVDPEMPFWYGVLNAAVAGYATQQPSWCAAAMTWTNAKSSEGVWVDVPCHRSKLSYPFLLADAIGAKNFVSQSCSGATLPEGIFAAQPEASAAQFGDWAAHTELNPSFEEVDPNVVTVGIGANDVRWVRLLKYCLASTAAHDLYNKLPSYLQGSFLQGLITGVLDGFVAELPTGGTWLAGDCTAENPGKLYHESMAALETLPQRHASFLRQLKARKNALAASTGRSAQLTILVQNYFSPIPKKLPPFGECADFLTFNQANLDFFADFSRRLNAAVQASVDSVQGEMDARLFDVEAAFRGHELCSATPHIFGLSIMLKGLYRDALGGSVTAVMHPTADGQAVMAATALKALQG